MAIAMALSRMPPPMIGHAIGNGQAAWPGKCCQLEERLMNLERHQVNRVVPAIRQWIREGNSVTSCGLDRVVRRLRSRKRYLQALMALDWVANEKVIPFGYHETLQRLDLCSRCHHVTRTLLLFRRLPKQWRSEDAYCILLELYYKRDMLEDAEKTMQELRGIGIKSLQPYHLMLSFYKLRGMEMRFERMVTEIKGSGLALDRSFYTILLAARDSFGGDMVAVEDVLAEMEGRGLKLDAVGCLAVAGIYLRSGLRHKSERVLQRLEKSLKSGEFKDSNSIRRRMLAMFGKLGDRDAVDRIWHSIERSASTTVEDFIFGIEAFGRVGKMDEAEDMYMRVGCNSCNPRLHNAFLAVLVEQGDVIRAVALVERMKGVRCLLSTVTYHLLIKVYLKAGDVSRATLAFESLRSAFGKLEWPRPSSETLAVMLEFFVGIGDVQASERLVKKWMEDGFPLSAAVFHSLFRVYAKGGAGVDNFPGRMLSAGVEPTRETEQLLRQISTFLRENSKKDFPLSDRRGETSSCRWLRTRHLLV
ncbi:pentatricopeptide repeat-containing protein At1g60770 [Selaginella moellendorffii]|uniref:pentatricopeptide repeat-containing protein At1g60770 n=1 Tax=Selaginella moellendorffii TaxID=88036 RepID=UPI000D1C9C0E|nr:pentatricopeptide repeat-containing protein At1g60770 [Selaginella moellendorffii]|eukprot:XP_024516908.1 pentatricopeptide repeat-containing protein At1g60770 [Selaginella moellendorffii]